VADSGIQWMEPRDLPLSAIQAGINAPGGIGVTSNHPGTILIAYADGSSRGIDAKIPQDIFEALLTRAGGEELPNDY
jgi:hypothetical protein